ncbi:calcium-binding protein [Phenylobacterium deserti]|nr:calcium-binding protein [Phenylobacterium deserti]
MAEGLSIIEAVDDVGPNTGSVTFGGYTNDTSPLIRVSLGAQAAVGDTVVLKDSNVAIGTFTVDAAALSAGSVGLQLTGLSSGWHHLSVALQAADGAEKATSGGYWGLGVETATPAAPEIRQVLDDAGAKTGAVSSGGRTDDASLTFTIFESGLPPLPQGSPGHAPYGGVALMSGWVHIYDGSNLVGSGLLGYGGEVTITTSALGAGDHTLTAVAVDRAGNASAPSTGFQVTIGADLASGGGASAGPGGATATSGSGGSATATSGGASTGVAGPASTGGSSTAESASGGGASGVPQGAIGGGAEAAQSLTAQPWGGLLEGGAGSDTLQGGDGLDVLNGGMGSDVLRGGGGFDIMNGNQGDDSLWGGEGDDWVVGGKDNDQLWGEAGLDIVFGNLGNDTCNGGDGSDLIRGGQGEDVLNGGAGADWLSGDRGDDTVTGGAGADIFHSFGDAGIDRITDFNQGEGDRLLLDIGTTYTVAQVNADTVVSMSGGGQVILVGVQASSLTSGWILG